MLTDSISGDLELLDTVLQAADDDLSTRYRPIPLRGEEIDACLRCHKSRVPDVDFFWTAKANGDVIHCIDPGKHLNIADRDFFKTARDNPSAGLIISRPVLSR